MQRSEPSPVWSAFFKKTPRYRTFWMYPSMLPSPRRGGYHPPARNNRLITYQVGRIGPYPTLFHSAERSINQAGGRIPSSPTAGAVVAGDRSIQGNAQTIGKG